jgi:hypothetical protein
MPRSRRVRRRYPVGTLLLWESAYDSPRTALEKKRAHGVVSANTRILESASEMLGFWILETDLEKPGWN